MPDASFLRIDKARAPARRPGHTKAVPAGRISAADGVRKGSGDIRPNQLPLIYAYLYGAGILSLTLYYLVFNPEHVPDAVLWLAAAAFLVGCAPLQLFLFRGRVHQIPCMEVHALFYAVGFGFAGFQPPSQLPSNMNVEWGDILTALWCTVCGLLALYAGYYGSARMFKISLRPVHPLGTVPNRALAQVAATCCALAWIAEYVSRRISLEALSQITSMLFTFGFFALFLLAYEKCLSPSTRLLVIFILTPMVLLLRGGVLTGQLAGVVGLVFWMSVVISRATRRIPLLLLTTTAVLFFVFQPVKFYVRDIIWTENRQVSVLETLGLYCEGFQRIYGSMDQLFAARKEAFQNSFDRVNHLVTTAAIIHDTPSSQPFLNGESYLPLLTKWIPRAFWPGKPIERFGNHWAVKYGYLNEADDVTSFNLPWLSEMYMNFGFWGVVVIMFLLGIFFQMLWRWIMESARAPVDYATAIVFAQALTFTESNLSLMLGGLMIFAILLVPFRALLTMTKISRGQPPRIERLLSKV